MPLKKPAPLDILGNRNRRSERTLGLSQSRYVVLNLCVIPHVLYDSLKYFQTFSVSMGPEYTTLPHWVNEVMPAVVAPGFEFDISPIRPTTIKSVLEKLSNTSAPGPDGIKYCHLTLWGP